MGAGRSGPLIHRRGRAAEDTSLDNVLEFVPVLGLYEGGLVEADLSIGGP